MIRLIVEKPADSSFKEWESSAQTETNDLIERWERACVSEEGVEKFSRVSPVKRSVYSREIVIASLREQYKNKCAFCERQLRKRDADIEHFRPKGKVKMKRGGKESVVTIEVSFDGRPVRVKHPGYFWLAYSWENLLLACSGCNRRLKRCLFPLKDEAMRAIAPGQEVAEDELLIHPGQISEDLTKHFAVHRNGYLIALSERAAACIEILDLNDEDLQKARRAQYELLRRDTKDLFCARRVPDHDQPSDLAEIEKRLEEARTGELQYSAAGRAAIEDWHREFDEKYSEYENNRSV